MASTITAVGMMATVAAGSLAPVRNLDRSLGDGGMPLLGQLGVTFERYGEGWAEAAWLPTELAGNPFGIVHGGVYGVIHDAAMNFAANSALESGDRVATLDVSYQTRRAPNIGDALAVRGEVVHLTRQVAYVESTVSDADGAVVSRRWARSSCAASKGDRHGDRHARTAGPRSRRIRRGWMLEILVGVGIYLLYDWLREQTTGTGAAAYRQRAADRRRREVPRPLPRVLDPAGLLCERFEWFMAFWNIYYGTIHFVIPVVALVWLYRKAPVRYVRWRNTILFMLGISILVFWAYPLMPPRLMPGDVRVRRHRRPTSSTSARRCACTSAPTGNRAPPRSATYGNLFAAMPSLHVGWSTWSTLAVWPLLRHTWAKVLWALYPVTIIFCIVVTANHWLLDAVGGWVVLGLGYLCAVGLSRLLATRRVAPGGHVMRAIA